MSSQKSVSHLRIVFAAILDFFTAFFIGGYVVAMLTGNTTEKGFQLNGAPALILFALVIGYFVAGKYFGGTIWQRILGTKK